MHFQVVRVVWQSDDEVSRYTNAFWWCLDFKVEATN